jgi:hypothetical protein
MANEISVSLRLAVNNGFIVHQENPGTNSLDMTGVVATGGIQSIGTTEEILTMGDVTSPGYAYFRNCDKANYVEIGVKPAATFYPFAKLKYGEAAIIRLGTSAPYAKANTGAVSLQYYILAD